MKPTLIYYSILKYRAENLAVLDSIFDVIELPDPSHDTPEILERAEAVLAPLGYKVDREKIDAMPKLKVIGSNTTGHPHIDVDYAAEKGIAVRTLKYEKDFLRTITPTAELTWGLLIAVTRNFRPAIDSVLDGSWDRRPYPGPAMLSQMSIGIVGLGRLGSIVADYACAFGMKVGYYDPFVSEGRDELVRYESLEELVAGHDIITVHVPHEPETENMFDRRLFDMFKKGSYFINTSRGELVDHQALMDELDSGRISGAAMDVFPDEFNPQFDITRQKMWKYINEHKNVIVTPHIAGSTEDAWRLTERKAIDMVSEIFKAGA